MKILNVVTFVLASFFVTSCSVPLNHIQPNDSFEEYNFGIVALIGPEFDKDGNPSDPTNLEEFSRNSQGEDHYVYCSGFFVSHSQILTAAHCVERMEAVAGIFGYVYRPKNESPVGDLRKISTYSQYNLDDQSFNHYKLVRVKKFNKEQDIALLEIVNGEPLGYKKIFSFGASPHSGDKVYAIGHPSGLPWTLTSGLVSAGKRNLDGQIVTQTSALTFFGNSGCPLIDMNGRAIGVASSIARTPHLAFYTHVDVLKEFIN